MGNSSYSLEDRSFRSASLGYTTKPVHDIFLQQKERKAHKTMMPTDIINRECRDNEANPTTLPIQLYLDVTGSMGHIPHDFIKTGLPTLMETLLSKGVPGPALMFGAVGDHETDRHPLQVGQFESGDAELDMWLTRTYLEGGGGGNSGESYLLAWYFAACHTVTDAWEKRNQKGFVFTIGDEPDLRALSVSSLKEIMGTTAQGQVAWTEQTLLAAAQEKNHVFHIFLEHGGRYCNDSWKQLLGDHLIVVKDYTQIPSIIAETILKFTKDVQTTSSPSVKEEEEKRTHLM